MEAAVTEKDTPEADLIPPLRPDLRLEEVEEAAMKVYRLVDKRYSRRIRLDRRGRDLALLLDRPQPFEVLLERIAQTGNPMKPESLRRVLEAFAGLGLLGDTPSPPLQNDWGEERLIIPEDLRFTCTGCGSCCLGVNVGPVGEEIASRMRAHSEELRAQEAQSKGLFFSMVAEDGSGEVLLCQTRNGACFFLDSQGLCRVHRVMGIQAKPLICRVFPFRFAKTPGGIVVSLQMECRNILRASEGTPVREQEAEIREILSHLSEIPQARPYISVDGEAALSFDDFLTLQRDVVLALSEALTTGGWAKILLVRQVLASKRRARTAQPVKDLKATLYDFLRDVGQSLLQLKHSYRHEGHGLRFDTANLDLAVDALSEAPLFLNQVLSDEEGETAHFASLLLLNFWRGCDEVLAPPDLITAASEFAFAWFLARTVAVSRTRRVHRFFVTSQDMIDAWVMCHMLLRNHKVRDSMRKHRTAMTELFFDRLEEVLARKAELEEASVQTDFFLF